VCLCHAGIEAFMHLWATGPFSNRTVLGLRKRATPAAELKCAIQPTGEDRAGVSNNRSRVAKRGGEGLMMKRGSGAGGAAWQRARRQPSTVEVGGGVDPKVVAEPRVGASRALECRG
jgi:hypothetical protein